MDFFGMPMPLSSTEQLKIKSKLSSSTNSALTIISPVSVNFIAFETKFEMTCLMRTGSPLTIECSMRVISRMNSKPLISACKATDSANSINKLRKSKCNTSKSSLPASTLEKSNISFSKANNDLALERAIFALYI